MGDPAPFWQRKPLTDLSHAEWESLCDGCGKCCLIKLEYEEDGGIEFTDIGCTLLDPETCRCRSYSDRRDHVPDCVQVTPNNITALAFMPPSCAYRLLAEGKELPVWHPLVSGDAETVHLAGMSARYRVISEDEIDEEDIIDHIVQWPSRPA